MTKRAKEELDKALGELKIHEEKIEEKQNELTHLALGTFQASNGEWYVARVKYNPETGKAGEFEKVEAGPGKAFAIEQFKIMAVKEKVVQ